MAAAANKPTAVHYFLVFFAFLSMLLGITTYMFYNESGSKFAEITKLNDENQKLNRSVKNVDDDIQELKKKIGINFAQVVEKTLPGQPWSRH